MGTNFPDFIKEANRVLKKDGKLFIAEVTSRFQDVKEFARFMKDDMGFKAVKINKLKDFFYVMVYEKTNDCKFISKNFYS